MKVLHVIDALGLGGGAEHSLAQLLPILRRAGVSSTVVCLVRRRGGLQAQLLSEGFDVRVLGGTSFVGRARALRALLRQESTDLIHASLPQSCLVTRVAALGLPVPQINSLVNTSYDSARTRFLGVSRWKLEMIRWIDGFTAKYLVDHFHAITDTVKRAMVRDLGISPDRVTVIPRGRSSEALGSRTRDRCLAVRRDLGLKRDQPVLLTVGRQDHQKGQAYLVRSMPRILRWHPTTQLLIAGREGSMSSQIRRAIQETRVDSSVHLLGHRTDIGDLLAAADVFVFPSLYEGLGGAVLEAMALGLPVVAFDIPAMREVVGHDVAGRLVPSRDVDALAETVHELLTHESLRLRLGTQARERFLERYTLEAVSAETIRMYQEISGCLCDGAYLSV